MRIFFIVSLMTMSLFSNAQKQNNNWCFGWGHGLEFNGSSLASFITASKNGTSCATVSDRQTGKLLFYATGTSLRDSTHNIMPNGNNIGTDSQEMSQQGTVIIPDPADNNKYYVFSRQSAVQNGDLTYSVVDMTLNAGKGDVINNKKNIFIRSDFAEGMTATYACDGQWLILFERNTNRFFSYKINAQGVNTNPVVSQMKYPYPANADGTIKVSPDGKHLILVTHYFDNDPTAKTIYGFVSLNDFEMKTGVVSNGQILENIAIPRTSTDISFLYSEFSPNSTKAYFPTSDSEMIYQYDLSLPNIIAIKASKKAILSSPFYNASLQMGPDSNIYTGAGADIYLNQISNADAAFPFCTYTPDIVKLKTYHVIGEFPQLVLERAYGLSPTYTQQDTSICTGSSIQVQGRPGVTTYLWSTGSTDSMITLSQTGRYWVRSGPIIGCGETIDTFEVYVADPYVELGNDTVICLGDKLTLTPAIKDTNAKYQWNDFSTNRSFTTGSKGKYYVTTSIDKCTAADTINVEVNDKYIFSLGNDTTLCKGDTYPLTIQPGLDKYLWNTGNTTNKISINEPGTYTLEGTYKNCWLKDSIAIDYYPDAAFNLGNDSTFCSGISVVLYSKSLNGSNYLWMDGSNQDRFTVTLPGSFWVTATNICGTFSDSIRIDFDNCDCNPFVPSAFSPNKDGLNDRLNVRINCAISSFDFKIFNRYGVMVFASNNPNVSWDGIYEKSFADIGTYYYMLKTLDINGKIFFSKGDLILVR